MIKETISKTETYARQKSLNFDSGHDWWHVRRVRDMALYINSIEKTADPFILEITALLHDTADSKFNADAEKEYNNIAEFLKCSGLGDKAIYITEIIKNISFSNKIPSCDTNDPVFIIIQDADRLDAIGAMGIARAFNYGGFRNNTIFDPENADKPSTIKHFYEKLLLLKDRMNTETAKKLAIQRHDFLQMFLNEFYCEWDFASKADRQNAG